jgi:peptide/nickel transport system permease protein
VINVPFQPVILMTDALIFILIGVIVAFLLYAARREHLRAPWAHVRRQPLAMAALVVLLAYVAVGLLDSLHFRLRVDNHQSDQVYYSAEVLSVLDLAASPLRLQVERTYSAPFALYAYMKETVERPDGTQTQVYPRLKYGGAHLGTPEQRAGDLAWRAFAGAIAGLGGAMLIGTTIIYLAVRRRGESVHKAWARVWRGQTDTPWRAMLLTTAIMLVALGFVIALAGKYHVFGTDQVGQDVLYKSLKSIRTGLVIGTLTTLVMLPFAVGLGIAAGYFRGWVDDIIQYIYTTLSSIPGVLLIAAAVLSLQVYMAKHADAFNTVIERADLRLLFLCLILGITSWTSLCRLLRGETLKLRQMEYIQAAVAFGVSNTTIMVRHVLPNVMHIVLIAVVLDFSGLVLAEAVLTYVGVGVDPGMHSWGNMINGARLEMAREPMVWWNLAAAFVFMFTLVLAANLFADAVREAFDPRVRKG